MELDRRNFVVGMLAALSVGSPINAAPIFANGEINSGLGTFDWSGGGNDPLQKGWRHEHYRATFAIARLHLHPRVQEGLQRTISGAPHARFNLTSVYEEKVMGDVMVSGNGTIALRPRLVSRRWAKGRSRMASWWVWTDRKTDERWEVIIPDVCRNLVLTRLGQAVPCVCDPKRDACAKPV